MQSKLSFILKNVLFIFLSSLFLCGIGSLIAYLIAIVSKDDFSNILTYIALFCGVIGILSSMRGNPTGIFMPKTGTNAQYAAFQETETTRIERDITNYYSNFKQHSIVDFTLNSFTIVLSAAFMLLVAFFVL